MKKLLFPIMLILFAAISYAGTISITNNGIQINNTNVCLVGGSYSFGALTVTTLNGYSVNQFVSASNNSCPTGSLCVQSGNVTDFKAQVLACNASSYCSQVLVPAGVYNVVNELNFTNVNNIHVKGQGLETIINYTGSSNSDEIGIVYFKESDFITFDNFKINGNYDVTAATPHGILFEAGQNNIIQNNYIDNVLRDGIKTDGKCSDCDKVASSGRRNDFNIIRWNTVTNIPNNANAANNIEVYFGNNHKIYENFLYNNSYRVGIILYAESDYNEIYNNYLKNIAEDGIQIRGVTDVWQTYMDNNKIYNNYLEDIALANGAQGILINVNVNNTFIYGNTLKNIGGNCIEFGGTGGRTYNTFLTNNHCYNWHQNAVGADNGIDSNGEFGVAIGNVLFSNGTVDCYSTTASQLNKSNNVCQGVFS